MLFRYFKYSEALYIFILQLYIMYLETSRYICYQVFDILGSWKYKAILDYYGTNHRDYATQCTNSPSKTDGINQPGLR